MTRPQPPRAIDNQRNSKSPDSPHRRRVCPAPVRLILLQPIYQAVLEKSCFSTNYYCSNFDTGDCGFCVTPKRRGDTRLVSRHRGANRGGCASTRDWRRAPFPTPNARRPERIELVQRQVFRLGVDRHVAPRAEAARHLEIGRDVGGIVPVVELVRDHRRDVDATHLKKMARVKKWRGPLRHLDRVGVFGKI